MDLYADSGKNAPKKILHTKKRQNGQEEAPDLDVCTKLEILRNEKGKWEEIWESGRVVMAIIVNTILE